MLKLIMKNKNIMDLWEIRRKEIIKEEKWEERLM
jgi:hypothetical protein